MKINVDKAIGILKDYIELDRQIREGDTEGDFNSFCEEKCLSIESLIEYIFASRCAFKRFSSISKQVKEVEDTKVVQLTEIDLKKILACLEMAMYHVDKYLSKEDKSLLLDYSYDLGYKISDILGIEDYDSCKIDIETLEVVDNK